MFRAEDQLRKMHTAQEVRDTMTGTSVTGQVVAGEFVRNEDDRLPGTYVTIRLDDLNAPIVGGRVSVTYLPAEK